MRFIVTFLLLFLLSIALCRPTENYAKENDKYEDVEEESDYDGRETDGINDNSQLQDEGKIDEKAMVNTMQQSSFLRSPNEYSKSQEDAKENFSENEPSELEDADLSTKLQYSQKQRNNNGYNDNTDNNDQPETAQHFPNREINSLKSKRIRDNSAFDKRNHKQNEKGFIPEEGSFLFENTGHDQKEKLNFNEDEDLNEEARYSRYYSSMNAKNDKNLYHDNSTLYRDRRQVSETADTSNNVLTELKSKEDFLNTDEEAAIKRHIDKLTNDELEQLLSTLSNDKRSLLTKIIMYNTNTMNKVKISDNEDANNEIKKREITKKASVIDENSFIENNQLEALKLDRDLNTELIPMIQSHDSNLTKCLSDSTINVTPEISSVTDEFKQSSLITSIADTFNDSTVRTELSKSAKKREINEFGSSDADESVFTNSQNPSSDEESFALQDEIFFNSINDEPEISDSRNTCKRDIDFDKNSNLADSIKSLQDSFPNSDSYDGTDPYLASNMAPLVRVKRDNIDVVVKKRAAAVLPDTKVAYLPYKPENDDEDNDEANEFDDDGFYVRTSNLAIDIDKAEGDSAENDSQLPKTEDIPPPSNYRSSENSGLESDNSNIGSDTDSVLSGSEGIDDNLMLSNCARNKRSEPVNKIAAEYDLNRENEELDKNVDHALMDEKPSKVSGNNMNFPNYQDNDAFDIPRNCEGEVNRYKRIRRVKHLPATDNMTKPNL